ncbi:MAG: energy-coupling factor ABC transporter ATP-binding protein [Candidatus Limnocylindrales bacterium]
MSASRPPAVVRLEGVSYVYPDGNRALAGIDLTIERGERAAIVGQNGSGKSTLARHLDGLLRPTAGRVLIEGQDIAGRSTADLARQVALLFQDPDLQLFEERIRSEVAFGPRNLGLRGAELEVAVAAALEAVGLSAEAKANPFLLGRSRRKLVALAAVLAMGSPIIVLDEPTTGQDARGVARVQAIVERLAAEGRTVIAVSHDLRLVAESFDRVVVLQAGAIVLDGAPVEVFSPEARPILEGTNLEPPPAARAGAAFGLGSTPTEASFVEALARRRSPGAGPPPGEA